MSQLDLVGAHWHTSSFSRREANQCVEVATLAHVVAVRDSKDRGGAVHRHSASAWRTFLAGVHSGEFDR